MEKIQWRSENNFSKILNALHASCRIKTDCIQSRQKPISQRYVNAPALLGLSASFFYFIFSWRPAQFCWINDRMVSYRWDWVGVRKKKGPGVGLSFDPIYFWDISFWVFIFNFCFLVYLLCLFRLCHLLLETHQSRHSLPFFSKKSGHDEF